MFCRIGFLQEIKAPLSFEKILDKGGNYLFWMMHTNLLLNDAHKIYWNLKTQKEKKIYLLNHVECIEMRWCRICTLQIFKMKIHRKGVPTKQFSYSVKLVSLLIPGSWVPSWIWGNFRKLEKSKYFQSCEIYYLENYKQFGS